MQQKGCLFELPSTCRMMYNPPHFIFSTYDHVLSTYPLGKSGSSCV